MVGSGNKVFVTCFEVLQDNVILTYTKKFL